MSAGLAPVTVVGGYLGAGKTTLVNHLLTNADHRMAVLVNDFGAINIDEELIADRDGNTMSLANGCICCSLADGLGAALATVMDFDPRPERVVIEASGVADPASIAAYAHAPGLRLDAVVVVVDAETIRSRATDKFVGDTVLRQLASADLLIVNKTDLVADEGVAALRRWLVDQAPGAAQVEAVEAAVANEVVFDRDQGRLSTRPGGRPPGPTADEVFETWSWSSVEPVNRDRIDALMSGLDATATSAPIYRAKGVVWLTDDPTEPLVLQRVGRRWSLSARELDRPAGRPLDNSTTHIVAIGAPGALGPDGLGRWLDPAP